MQIPKTCAPHETKCSFVKAIYLPPANEVCESYVLTRVCHSVHMGGLPQCMLGYPPPGPDTPPRPGTPQDQAPARAQCMLGDTVNERAVCILLECNLAIFYNGIYLMKEELFKLKILHASCNDVNVNRLLLLCWCSALSYRTKLFQIV